MDMDKYIGRLLDNRYEILEVIGTGGMAVVYKARCHRLNRLVAVKILKDEYSQDEEFRRRFHAEGQAVAMLSHSNIVSVYDVSTTDYADYIVMELIDGITLKQYMEKKGVLNWKETLHFAIQIAKALEHAHGRGIIHRDIKPHNVMVLKNGSVKVADFGIARVMSKSNSLTKEALGSVHYISPEQAKGGRVDNRSDLYSLGVVMYEMMTGRPPYDGETPVAVAIQHINGKAAMPTSLNPNVPGGLEQIIMRAMAQRPGKRFATATEMLADMDEFRKDPTVLFDYNNTTRGLDASAQLLNEKEKEQSRQPAQERSGRREAARGGEKEVPEDAPPKPRKPRRQKEIVVDEDDSRSWVATVAIILCALVAVAAIGVFVYALLGADTGPKLVTVPNLVNKDITSEQIGKITDLVIREERIYSETYEAGKIVEQNPAAGIKVQKGTEVIVKVSLGPKPQELLMEDLILQEEATAKKFLTETQGIPIEKIEFIYESSNTVEAGFVIKTKPEKGESLTNVEKVQVYVSSGKEIPEAVMPNVLDRNIETAEKVLNYAGFKNIIREEVDSDKAQGTVVGQSAEANVKIPLSTIIVLQVSKGQTELPPETQEPTIPPELLVSKVIPIPLPTGMAEPYVLTVRKGGEIVEILNIPVGAIQAEVELRGLGTEEFEVWIGESRAWTFSVMFTEDVIEPDDPTQESTGIDG